MIAPERFLVQSAQHRDWLTARRGRASATDVAKAATPSGMKSVLEERAKPEDEFFDNDYMKFGRDNENWIAMEMKREYGILPNSWLIASEQSKLYVATPDCLSLDHTEIGEIKTGGTQPGKNPPLQHIRQMQWQLFCSGAQLCHYAFLLRVQVNGIYVPGWMEPRFFDPIHRDELMIEQLIATADLLLETERKAQQ